MKIPNGYENFIPSFWGEFERVGTMTGRIKTKEPMFEEIDRKETKQRVFVFGSNREGRHGAGAAKEAVQRWGAKYGQADGRQGNAYAIITKELRKDEDPVLVSEARNNVRRFIHYAERHPEIEFIVTPVGTGLAGFNRKDILPLFENEAPDNCIFTWKNDQYKNYDSMEPWDKN